MKIIPVLFAKDMQETMDFYISLGFEARDVMQEGDNIESMKLIYRENEETSIIFFPAQNNDYSTSSFILRIEEKAGELPEHFQARYGAPKQLSLKDPNGYQLEFIKV